MINLIFLGGLFPDAIKNEIISGSKGIAENAANALQWNIVEGLEIVAPNTLSIINAPFVGPYPRLSSLWKIPSCLFSYKNSINNVSISFINIRPFKSYVIKSKIYNELQNKLSSENKNVIIIYSATSEFIEAALKAKKRYNDIHICLIIPDLPIYMSTKGGIYYKIRGYLKQKSLDLKLPMIDCFVLLTKAMSKYLNIEQKPFIVIEGITDRILPYNVKIDKIKNTKTILYSGTLAKKYGILTLLEAFKMINDPSYKLWICGYGDAIECIQDSLKSDKRITFFGQIDRNEVLLMQQKATLLINPRSSFDEYTKYSFPSKTMEYMRSGTPVLMNKLPGIPEEYHKYIFFFNETADSLAEMIQMICSKEQEALNLIGNKAKEFILTEKTSEQQCAKIISLIKSVI